MLYKKSPNLLLLPNFNDQIEELLQRNILYKITEHCLDIIWYLVLNLLRL